MLAMEERRSGVELGGKNKEMGEVSHFGKVLK